MKEMTLREIQLQSLDLLKIIRDFCNQNSITYFMAYGTLLGAVRHKGFIPWDDDIDITMPRPDYEKFCQTFPSSSNVQLFTNSNSGSLIAYARICDMQHTQLVFTEKPWNKTQTGIYIDIFPLDAVEQEHFEDNRQKAVKLWRRTWAMRFSLTPFSSNKGISKKCKWLTRRLTTALVGKKRIQKLIGLCTATPWDATTYLCQFTCPDPHEKIIRKEWCQETVLLPFEDDMFAAPKCYHEVLTNIFGDYMQLPPEEERVPHTSYARFYWKK